MNLGSRLKVAGTLLVGVMILLAIFGPILAPYPADAWIGSALEHPSSKHWFGTDDMGHDLWSIWLHGARHTVLVALLAGVGAAMLGALIGSAAGYLGGRWDFLVLRLIDVQLTLPTLPLVLVLAFYIGTKPWVLIAVMIVTLWAQCARELRPQAVALRNLDFVVSQKSMGASTLDTLLRHILPNLSKLIWAQCARLAHHAVLLESSLAFLGLGDSERPSWGTTLYYANARAAFLGDAWQWWIIPPGLAIAGLCLSFALIGVGKPRGAALSQAVVPAKSSTSLMPGDQRSLRISDLTLRYAGQSVPVLNDFNLNINKGEILGLLGVSGAGKSTVVQSLLGLLPTEASIESGSVWFGKQELLRLTEAQRQLLRGKHLAWVPQAAMQSLNPVRSVASQLNEVAKLAGYRNSFTRAAIIQSLMQEVGLKTDLLNAYPHQLSGGMRQRVVLAMALCQRPDFLLADEPSSGLDKDREQEILRLLVQLCRNHGMGLLLISHDLKLLQEYCDELAVLENGQIVEQIRSTGNSEHFTSLTSQNLMSTLSSKKFIIPKHENCPVFLDFQNVDFSYSAAARLHNITFQVHEGECVGLIGPSGAGKSTIARLALGLEKPQRGTVRLFGMDWSRLTHDQISDLRQQTHLIFQDPYSALPHRLKVIDIIAEPLRLAGIPLRSRYQAAQLAIAEVGLVPPEKFLNRYVDHLSGGQRQRVALARALIHRPRLIVADEPTSMLDAVAKTQWLELLERLRFEYKLAVLLITHDIDQAQKYCDHLLILDQGRITNIYSPRHSECHNLESVPNFNDLKGVYTRPATLGLEAPKK